MMFENYPSLKFHIAGIWTSGSDVAGRKQEVYNPADGSVLGELPLATQEDLDEALKAAKAGLEVWRAVPPAKRAAVLLKASSLLRERVDYIASLSSLELGAPLASSKSVVLRSADLIDWDANEGRRLYGRVIPSEPGTRHSVVVEPVGVVAAFTPWNAPVLTLCRKIGSALATGCSIIVKAAEETPATSMAVVQAFLDAGTPPGVINLVFGNPPFVSSTLINSPVVRMITFTGSGAVGKHLAQMAGVVMKPLLLELGGHAPAIIWKDADVSGAAIRSAAAKFANAGQVCFAPTRFIIHEAVYDEFAESFCKATSELVVGPYTDPKATFGPLASRRRLVAIDHLVSDAVSRGARVLHGGSKIEGDGYFYNPTILDQIPADSLVLTEEPFGPIACLSKISDVNAAIAMANNLQLALAGYVFSRSAAVCEEISRRLECGVVGVNHFAISAPGIPFGGVKDSGYGREGGVEGVQCYTVSKTISENFVA